MSEALAGDLPAEGSSSHREETECSPTSRSRSRTRSRSCSAKRLKTEGSVESAHSRHRDHSRSLSHNVGAGSGRSSHSFSSHSRSRSRSGESYHHHRRHRHRRRGHHGHHYRRRDSGGSSSGHHRRRRSSSLSRSSYSRSRSYSRSFSRSASSRGSRSGSRTASGSRSRSRSKGRSPSTVEKPRKDPRDRSKRSKWENPAWVVGEKVKDLIFHLCDVCENPIVIYGRLNPCKHVFCLSCAKGLSGKCLRCKKQYQTLDQYPLGSIYMCFEGNACRRTYLSERDLQAHFNHRHLPKSTAAGAAAAAGAASLPTTSNACGLVGVSMPPPLAPPSQATASPGPQAGVAAPLQFPAPTSGLLSAAPLAPPHPATLYNQQAGAFLLPPGGGAGGSAAAASPAAAAAAPFQPNIPPPTHPGLGPQPMPAPPRIPPLMSVVSGRGPPLSQQHRLGLNSASAAAVAAAQNTAAANMTAAFAVAAAIQQQQHQQQQQQAPAGLILDQMPVNALCQPPPRSLQHPTAPMWPHTTSLSNIGQNRGPV